MNTPFAKSEKPGDPVPPLWRCGVFALILALAQLAGFAQQSISTGQNDNVLVVEDAGESEIFAFGKTVIVRKEAKNVLAFGGDVIVEGSVRGDVAAVGGSVIQKEGAFIGGDIFALGGSYRPESANPLRNPGRETVMYAGYEEEIRNLALNPAQILSPALSWTFLVQRILSVLFWFIVSMAFTTIAPGAVGRAVARFQLSGLKITAIGTLGLLVTTVGLILGLSFLPGFLGTIIGMMAMFLLVLAYAFGRVALQVSSGKLVQKHLLPDKYQSETMAILIGVVAWTVVLSVPYVWTLALAVLFSASIGLVVTARSANPWQRARI